VELWVRAYGALAAGDCRRRFFVLATIGKEKVAVPKLFYNSAQQIRENCKMIGF
jgi:hypothetical protein